MNNRTCGLYGVHHGVSLVHELLKYKQATSNGDAFANEPLDAMESASKKRFFSDRDQLSAMALQNGGGAGVTEITLHWKNQKYKN